MDNSCYFQGWFVLIMICLTRKCWWNPLTFSHKLRWNPRSITLFCIIVRLQWRDCWTNMNKLICPSPTLVHVLPIFSACWPFTKKIPITFGTSFIFLTKSSKHWALKQWSKIWVSLQNRLTEWWRWRIIKVWLFVQLLIFWKICWRVSIQIFLTMLPWTSQC